MPFLNVVIVVVMTHFKSSPLYFPSSVLYFTFIYFTLKMPKVKPVTLKNQPNGIPKKRKSLTVAQKRKFV